MGPRGERCFDCIKYDPGKKVCRAKAPIPQVAPEGGKYTLVLPTVLQDDYCMDDFEAVGSEAEGTA